MTNLEQLIAELVATLVADPRFLAQLREVVREELAAGKPVEFLTVKEYARRNSVHPSTVRAAVKAGRLRAKKVGAAWRVAADAVFGQPIVAEHTRHETTSDFVMRVVKGGRR